ncbi:MAG: hypothetical protein R3242_04815 [Akkermansiaceae bacterium]|nr:hypothetical protein [Akkermansiaceae bacterium]
MNAPPDDNTLALWLDDELEGEEFERVEAWAVDHPDQLAAREQVRKWRKMIAGSVPAAEEPPAPEFFNERILHSIRESQHAATDKSRKSSSWNPVWIPLAACAGMALAFWLGALLQPEAQPITGEQNIPTNKPNLYVPEDGVNAEWISSADASATVIVLKGVNAIPDEVDFTATALNHTWREIDSTASSDNLESEE